MKVKTKRKICVIIGFAAAFFMFGVVGGMEQFYISIREGITYMIISLIVGTFAFYKSGYLK